MNFCYFVIICPWKRAWLFFYHTWILFSQGCFEPRLLEIGPVVLDKKIFKLHLCIFTIFVIISPCKWAWPFIWTNLNPLYPKMLFAKFGWLGQLFWSRKWKVYRQTDRRTMGDKKKSQLSFQLRRANEGKFSTNNL